MVSLPLLPLISGNYYLYSPATTTLTTYIPFRSRLNLSAKTKICQFYGTLHTQQNIVRFYISVYDTVTEKMKYDKFKSAEINRIISLRSMSTTNPDFILC